MHPPGFRSALVAAALTMGLSGARPALAADPMPQRDRVRLAEAFHLARATAGSIWAGLDTLAFPVLLVGPQTEYLVHHPRPTSDFVSAGYDSLLQTEVFTRPRKFPTHFLATFPAVGGIPTVVVGEAESTQAKSSTPWVVTLQHEHFHQMQYTRPGYAAGVEALGLSGGDSSGMWMLNYPFPYSKPAVADSLNALCRMLGEALDGSLAPARIQPKWSLYRKRRAAILARLKPADARYLDFQAWQEGVAMYTELRAYTEAFHGYSPTAAFRALPDFKLYSDRGREMRKEIVRELKTLDFRNYQRVGFYYLGAGEALMGDAALSRWKEKYFSEPFAIRP